MNCTEFRDQLMEMGKAGTLHGASLEHERDCAECASAWKSEQRLRDALHAMAEEDRGLGASPRVEAALLAKFRERQAATVVAMPAPERTAPRRWYIPASIAAAALVGAILISRWNEAPPAALEAQSQRAVASQQASESAVPGKEAVAQEAVAKQAVPVQTAKASPAQPRALRSARVPADRREGLREVATDFIPLVYGQVLDPAERAQLLRVNVPRSAMRTVGLPVREERMDERVPADLLVGEDGTPRAIRFVSLAGYRY